MLNLFRLMPEHPIIPLKESLTSHTASQKLTGSMNLFGEEPLFDIKGKKRQSLLVYQFIY